MSKTAPFVALLGLLAAAALLPACGQKAPTIVPPDCFRFDAHVEEATLADGEQVERPAIEPIHLLYDGGTPRIWTAGRQDSSCTFTEGALNFAAQQADYITSPDDLGIDGRTTDSIAITMSVTGADRVQLSWRPRGEEWGSWDELHRVITVRVPAEGQVLDFDVRMAGLKAWRYRTIDGIRLSAGQGAQVHITRFQVVPRKSIFAEQDFGARDYSIADRLRPCLFMHCPGAITYRLTLPERASFTSGLGLVDEGAPAEFTLDITVDGAAKNVLTETLDSATAWRDVEVDLAEYAGREAEFRFSVKSLQPGQVALWSSPAILQRRSSEGKGRARQAPNVLVYIVDSLPAKHLDVYGYERTTAPHLTAFAKTGTRFAHCYAQETWTKPSMTTLATGVDTFVHGIRGFGDVVPEALTMLPEALRNAGFVTCAITENPHTPPDSRTRRAYSYLEVPYLAVELGEPPARWNELPAITCEAASTFLEQNRDKPFFLYIHTMECHDIGGKDPNGDLVYDPPEVYRGKWSEGTVPRPVDLYDETIRFADSNFQRVLDKLDELALRGDTLVIFSADHGEAFKEHEGIQGHYTKPYNELIHIPLIMAWPGVVPAQTVITPNVAMIDLPTTILDYAGLETQEGFQGRSLAPLLRSGDIQAFRERTLFSTWLGVTSAINGPWKVFNDAPAGKQYLFNLEADPHETKDLKDKHPQVFEWLSGTIRAHQEAQEEIARAIREEEDNAVQALDPTKAALLENLGYLGGDEETQP